MESKCITQIICGVLFDNTFKLFDKWGEMADRILFSSEGKSVFGEEYYNRISNESGYQRSLYNCNTNNSLVLTQNNLIITHNTFGEGFNNDYEFLKKVIKDYIYKRIIKDNVLIVRRLGIVFICNRSENDLQAYKSTILNSAVCNDINDFRFSKKETIDRSLVQSGSNDYVNKIITLGQIFEDAIGLSFDYQHFFEPAQADIGKYIDHFFEQAYKDLEKEIAVISVCIEGKKGYAI